MLELLTTNAAADLSSTTVGQEDKKLKKHRSGPKSFGAEESLSPEVCPISKNSEAMIHRSDSCDPRKSIMQTAQ